LEVSVAAPLDRGANERPAQGSDADQDQGGASGKGGNGGGGGGGATGAGSSADTDTGSDVEHAGGQVNPLSIENPVCGESLSANEKRNCFVTGTPESRYPTSNYGVDIHIDTGLDNIVGNFQNLLAQLANAIWMALLFVLSLVMTLLGWAFELSPFTDNGVMAEVSAGLERFYRVFTSPFFVFALVAVGAWGVYRGLVRREFASAIAGTAMTVALMLLGLWILHEPRATVGTVAEITNDAAVAVIAAPQEGGLSNPQSAYAGATAEVWSAMTLPGFSAMNFSDMEWALSEADPELLAKANETACRDYAYMSILPREYLERLATADLLDQLDCSEVGSLVPAPRTNAEIWLRSSPGSEARDSLWDEFNDDYPYASYLAIQGDSGAWTRLPLVLLIGLGLLGGILLLAWLAIRIFVQTAVAFVLVLSTPIALFMPAFGERGRAAFAFWGGTLAGALISKLVYAALLSVVLFATTVIASAVPEGAGAFMAFLVMAGLWWAVFLKRDDILSFLSVSQDEGGSGRLSNLTGLLLTRQIARSVTGAIGGTGRTAARGAGFTGSKLAGVGSDRVEGARGAARAALERQAEKRLGARYDADKVVTGEQAERRSQLAGLAAQRTDALKEARRHGSLAKGASAPERERHIEAKRAAEARAAKLRGSEAELREQIEAQGPREAEARSFVSQSDQLERTSGERFSAQQVAQAKEGIRRAADKPVGDSAHAWRVGMSPKRYASLSGRERETARAEVQRQLRADGIAFGAVSDRPAGLVRARNRSKMRRQLRSQPGGRRQLHEARSHAASRRRRSSRRGISR